MHKYAHNLQHEEKSVKIYGRGLRVSQKNSVAVCAKLTGMNLEKGKQFLDRLLTEKESMRGKYYTNVVKELSSLLKLAESNAEFKGLDTNRMIIYASAHKGFTFFRPRSWKNRRTKRKMANLQIVLEQR